jgi:hypothetical protein
VSSGTEKFGVDAGSGALAIMTTAKKTLEAAADELAANCLKWIFI